MEENKMTDIPEENLNIKIINDTENETFVLQNIQRPNSRGYGDQGNINSALFKPKVKKLHLKYDLNKNMNYDNSATENKVS